MFVRPGIGLSGYWRDRGGDGLTVSGMDRSVWLVALEKFRLDL